MSNTARTFKDSMYSQLARMGKAFSAPARLELLDLLCQAPRTVETLARQAGISIANASQHLRILHGARLVEARKRGVHVEYRIADGQALKFLHLTREVAESRIADMGAITTSFLKSRDAFEPVSAEELIRRVREGKVTVLDVRPTEEYCAGHIPGAISAPLDKLEECIARLPKNRTVVAYCRGPYCVMAIDAVHSLRKAGYRAHRMEQGILDWRVRGWRIESGRARSGPTEARP